MHAKLLDELESLYKEISLQLFERRIIANKGVNNNIINIRNQLDKHFFARLTKKIKKENFFSNPIRKKIKTIKNKKFAKLLKKPSIVKKLHSFSTKTLLDIEIHHSIATKLKNSTIEHIHKASKFSYQNNIEYTNLHLEIANNALKESAHYMNKKQFKLFKYEVNGLIKEILAH